jgi:hypothetical protein
MDYQGNTDKERSAKGDKQIVKVVTGEVIQKPDSLGKKFKNIFFGGDLKTSAKYVTADVVLPTLRDLLVDAITNGAKNYIYGDSRFRRTRSAEYRPQVHYNNPINRASVRDPRERSLDRRPYIPDQPHPYRNTGNIDRHEIVLARKEDAELVVERLIDVVSQFEVATLADYYDLCGIPSSHIDNKWGWTYLNNIEIRQTRDGYVIDLPPLEAI